MTAVSFGKNFAADGAGVFELVLWTGRSNVFNSNW